MINDMFLILIFLGVLSSIYSVVASILKFKRLKINPEKSISKDILFLSWVPVITAVILYIFGFVYPITYEFTRDIWTALGNGIIALEISVGGFLLIFSSYLTRRALYKNNLIKSNVVFLWLFITSISLIVVFPVLILFFSTWLYGAK